MSFDRLIMQKTTSSPVTLILIFSLLLSCCTPPEYADVVLYNGKIITVDGNFSIHEAVAVKGSKILATGKNDVILNLAGKPTKMIDLAGKTVIPGIIDAHTHPLTAAVSEHFQPIPDLHTINELLEWVKSEALRKEPGNWIIHPKFFATRLYEMRQPTIDELDSVAPDNPVFLNGSYGAMVNSMALEVSGITAKTTHQGIVKDAITGVPTGFIRGSASGLLKLPAPEKLDAKQKSGLLKKLFEHYNSVGITSICSGSGKPEDLRWYEALRDSGELTVRVYHNLYAPFGKNTSVDDMITALNNFDVTTGSGDSWVKVGALKIILDGGILTGSAYLRQPWGDRAADIYGITDPSYRGIINFSHDELVKIIAAANDSGWKFTAHVTGGGAVDILLDAMEEVNMKTPIRGRRFSIIHGNFYTPAAMTRMAEMDVYADMQPAWFYKDAELIHHVLGAERIRHFHPYKSLLDYGIMVNGGSDHMVKLDSYTAINPYNPFVAMWSVITRNTEKGSVFVSEEAINREQALKMYTINNAYASFEEDIKGSIEPGKLADLAVLSDDLMTCPTDSIKQIKVILTMVNGKIVYERGSM